MGPPSQPLPLNATNLALLQTRQVAQTPAASDEKPAPEPPRPAPPPGSGRGRLIDILA